MKRRTDPACHFHLTQIGGNSGALRGEKLLQAMFCQVEQSKQIGAGEWGSLRCSLRLNERSGVGHDHIGVGLRV
jgi:hypothetical protein